jgi:hypothetical protein
LKAVLTAILFWVGLFSLQADDDRIYVPAKINGQPVRLAFDTGSGFPYILFSSTAQRLNLSVRSPPAGVPIGRGQVPLGLTSPQKLDLGFTNFQADFGVIEVPSYLHNDIDGAVGWPAFNDNVCTLDFSSGTLSAFTNNPDTLSDWIKCRIQTNSDLTLELPDKSGRGAIISLDSGTSSGVKLNTPDWLDWESKNAGRPATVDAYFQPGAGLVVTKEDWAEKISLGNLRLTKVPVMQASSADIAMHAGSHLPFEATLGMAALERMDVVLDGIHRIVYLRPKKTPPLPYEHNRLGAVFTPNDFQSDDLVAHVIDGSPGYIAGIRDGDVLLKIGDLDCTQWRTDPNVLPLSRFFERPEETALKLKLKRGDKVFETTTVLQNILPPDAAAAN